MKGLWVYSLIPMTVIASWSQVAVAGKELALLHK